MTSFTTTYTMKATDLPWLATIPEHWQLCRAKQIFFPVDIRSVDGWEEILTVSSTLGIVPRKFANVTMFEAISYEGYKLCWPGDLVINSLWAWAFALGVSQYHGVVSTAYGVYRLLPRVQVDLRFIHLLLRSVPFQWELQTRSKGIWISRLQLTDESFLEAPLPLPTLEEQMRIAKYLEHADQMLRGGVSQKLELAELMEEYKRAVIQQAVTRGLDPDVPLKPSGVERLGDIPEHWEVRRLKSVAELVMGQSPSSDDCSDTPVGLPFLQGCAEFGDLHPNPEQFCLAPPRVALAGSILMSVRAPVGRLNMADQDYGIGRGLCGIIPDGVTLLDDFAYYQLQVMEDALRLVSTGSTYEAVSTGDVGGQVVVTPPLTEQTAIVAHLDKLTSDIDAAIADTRREIELLEEYRTRLIADVVTGKLDVREAAANLLDVGLDDIQPLAEGGEAGD